MKQSPFSPKLLVFAVLFFGWTQLFVFVANKGDYIHKDAVVTHIIDSHLIPDSSVHNLHDVGKRFFDANYVYEAAKRYQPQHYLRSFYIVDFFFPFIYAIFFLALAAYWKGTLFYKIFSAGIVVCMLLDLSENTTFLYYLFHQEGRLYHYVAIFTTLKSVLFFLGMLTAAGAFLWSVVHWFRNKNKLREIVDNS
jgi:hypothetical protein